MEKGVGYIEADYSILDFKTGYDKVDKSWKCYFKEKLVLEVPCKKPDGNHPHLVWNIQDTNLNTYLKVPFITAGNYDEVNLYNIDGVKITKDEYWGITEPHKVDDKLFFTVFKSIGCDYKKLKGVIDENGEVLIPVEYEDYISFNGVMIQRNNLMYVEKNKEYFVLNLQNEIIKKYGTCDELYDRLASDLSYNFKVYK